LKLIFVSVACGYSGDAMDRYNEAHLYVGAIRVLHHQFGAPPSLEDVCEMLSVSVESGHAVCRDLKKRGIIDTAEDPFSIKLSVAEHLEIEKIPKGEKKDNSLAEELARFQAKKKNMDEKVASIQAEISKKKKDMFSDIEAKFKKEMDKFKGK
jgi:hypothetical protein